MSSVQLPGDPSHKLLLGRLYHTGIKLSALCETFEVEPKTLRRWGQALGGWWGVKPVTSYRTRALESEHAQQGESPCLAELPASN